MSNTALDYESNYRGESVGKKVARFMFWGMALQVLLKNKTMGRIVVLPSAYGGDVSCLHGMSVPYDYILAIDSDRAALEHFRKQWPEVPSRYGDIGEVLTKEDAPAMVHLDFCAGLNSRTITTVRNVMDCIPVWSYLGVTLLRGRERDESSFIGSSLRIIGNPDGYINRVIRTLSEGNIGRAMKEYAPFKMPRNPTKDEKTAYSACNRMYMFQLLTCAQANKVLLPLRLYTYHSRSESSHGSPMMMLFFKVARATTDSFLSQTMNRGVVNDAVYQIRHTTEADLRDLVLRMEYNFPDEDHKHHLKFNIPKQRVAAWKAWRTMGKYEEADRPFVQIRDPIAEPLWKLNTTRAPKASKRKRKASRKSRKRHRKR
jgi:hypothetical protein